MKTTLLKPAATILWLVCYCIQMEGSKLKATFTVGCKSFILQPGDDLLIEK